MSNVLTLSVVNLEFIGNIAEEIDTLASLLLELKRESPGKLAFTEK